MPHFVFRCLAMACSAHGATAFAQQTPASAAHPLAQDVAPSSVYRSAWSGYRPFADEKVISWKEANDAVGRIGGWRTYLRESQGSTQAPAKTDAKEPASVEPDKRGGGAHKQ
jgi:hypothetical protein